MLYSPGEKMKKNAFKILAALCLCCQAGLALAGGFRMNWVESEVILDKDGKAQVSYTVRWTGTGGQLHGFYFEGFQETPVFDSAKAYAVDNAGRRYGLDIKRLSSTKYDIVLANGEAFSNGEITYFFRYACDLQASGNLTQTIADGRKLAVFNWSPVQWDDALEHEALVVRYPVELASAKVDDAVLAKLNFRTEKFVNERYMIDYPTVANAAGKHIFSTRFFRKNLDSRYHFQVQVYLDAAPFALDTIASGGLASPAPEKAVLPPLLETSAVPWTAPLLAVPLVWSQPRRLRVAVPPLKPSGLKRTRSPALSSKAAAALGEPMSNQLVPPSVEYCHLPVAPPLLAPVMAIPCREPVSTSVRLAP